MDWLPRIVLIGIKIVMEFFSLPFFIYYKYFTKQEIVPRIKNKILMLSVNELLCKMQINEIKSKEIVLAYINRIKEVNPLINAVVQDRFEAAIKESELADKIRSEISSDELNNKYPLLGIPFTVKESIGLKGFPQTGALVKYAERRAPDDAIIVERLKAAGAIPLLVTVTSEFCNNLESSSLLYGRCRNPYDLRRVTGGSSSGEAALNGAGASLFGTGSDLCGSIRLPCFFTGVYGMKPTGGMISPRGHFPNIKDPRANEYMQLGIITRFATDLDLLLKITVDEKKRQLLKFDRIIDVKKLKIFYINEINLCPCSPRDKDIQNSFESVLNYFKTQGHEVTKFRSKELKHVIEILLGIACSLNGIPSGIKDDVSSNINFKTNINFLDIEAGKTSLSTEFLKNLLGISKYSFPFLLHEFLSKQKQFLLFGKVKYWLKKNEILKRDLLNILKEDTVIIMPTSNEMVPFPNMILKNLAASASSTIWNSMEFPATHIPIGLNSEGLPLGVEVIAGPNQDRTCIAVANYLEKKFGGWKEAQSILS